MKPKIIKSYSINNGKCLGFQFDKSEFIEYLSTTIKEKYCDVDKSKALDAYIKKSSILKKLKLENKLIKNKPIKYELWRAGEIISRCYLEDYQHAIFPYDKRWGDINQNASPGGLDQIGFIDKKNPSLLFVEIKTTTQKNSPPSIMYELRDQIMSLFNTEQRDEIIIYVLMNIKDKKKQLRKKFDEAVFRHYKNNLFIVLGILVKEENPNEVDLKKSFEILKPFSHDENLELHAIYLPIPSSCIKGYLVD